MAPARALGVLTIARCHLPRQHENVINGDRSVITRTAARRRRRRWGVMGGGHPGRVNRFGASTSGAVGTVAVALVCAALSLGAARRSGMVSVEGNPMGTLPSISSSCIKANKACVVAVPGGSLRLSDIRFPHGTGAPGSAEAVGYVNGQFVSGTIKLSSQLVHAVDTENLSEEVLKASGLPAPSAKQVPTTGGWAELPSGWGAPLQQHKQQRLAAQKTKAKWLLNQQLRAQWVGGRHPVKGGQQLADGDIDHDKLAAEQYDAALAAVEGHMQERMDKVEGEAKKIAEAVTKVITSPEVSKKIADLAMDAAASRAGPASEASLTGAQQAGVWGEGQFGYSNEPAGTEGGADVSANNLATTPDLDTVATSSAPASSLSYSAWKAAGAPMGKVASPQSQPTQPPGLVPPVKKLNGLVFGGGSLLDPDDGFAAAAQLHQIRQEGQTQIAQKAATPQHRQQAAAPDMGGSMMAQMEAIAQAPGGASAAAQFLHSSVQSSAAQPATPATQTSLRGGLTDPWGAFSAFQRAA